MATVITLLDTVSSNVNGAAHEVLAGRDLSLYSFGSATGAVRFQGSLDGANWFNLPSTPSGVGQFGSFVGVVAYIRGVSESISGGSVTLQALQSDED